MKKLMMLQSLLLVPVLLIAQSSMQGKVLDEKKEGLIGASVQVLQNGIFYLATSTDFDGNYSVNLAAGVYDVEVSYTGYKTANKKNVRISSNVTTFEDFTLYEDLNVLQEVIVKEFKLNLGLCKDMSSSKHVVTNEEIAKMPSRNVNAIAAASAGVIVGGDANIKGSRANSQQYFMDGVRVFGTPPNTEAYATILENPKVNTRTEQVSTFSLDVDKAAYANVRRFINLGQRPPADAVRIEEMINYFSYEYAAPKNKDILAVQTKVLECPWNQQHHLLHLGVQSKQVDTKALPLSNLVFLIDVSGSMDEENKLPLVIQSFKLLLDQLRPEDRVAIVTYAGRAGVPLPSTKAANKSQILKSLEELQAGGSTAGAQGILTAYEIAEKNFIKEGNNRVILATDGDFNVGVSDNNSLEKLIEEKRKSGVFLSVLGFGYGNYKDEKLQLLADKGNGNHAYIDGLQEAKKVFVKEFGGTIYTLAKDVKFQVEFNPAVVSSYRLIGYENRMLENEAFNNDSIDAGELGMGHQMTAIYEIDLNQPTIAGKSDELKYTSSSSRGNFDQFKDELATIKFRYKKPDSNTSAKWEQVIPRKVCSGSDITDDVKFSTAVAYAGMLIRESTQVKTGNFDAMIALAKSGKSKDDDGFRSEFIRLMEIAKNLRTSELATKE